MKLLIIFAIVAVVAVFAEPEPFDSYNNNYQRKNVQVEIRKRPILQKVIIEKQVPVIQKVIVERRVPVLQKVIVERQIPIVKKIVEVAKPRQVVVVRRPSYNQGSQNYGNSGSYGGKGLGLGYGK